MESEVYPDKIIDQVEKPDAVDIAFAILWPLIVTVCFCAGRPNLLHWFIIPTYCCGVVVGVDASRWLRGKTDLYDAKGIIGVFGCHFFVIVPLLVAYNNMYEVDHVIVVNMKHWLGCLGFFNFFGLLTYNLTQKIGYKKPVRAERTYWSVDSARVGLVVPITLGLVYVAYIVFTVMQGGLAGLFLQKTYGVANTGLVGAGPLLVLGRSVPMVTLLAITLWRYNNLNRSSSKFTAAILMMVFLVIQFITSGFSGSRSSTVWGLFWALGVVHFFWVKIPRKWIFIGMVPFMAFMFFYGFYKSLGTQAFELFKGRSVESLVAASDRSIASTLVWDLGRANVQAAEIYIVSRKPWSYKYRYGSTYPTSVIPLIPRRIWPNRPDDSGKVIAGTEMFGGPGSYISKNTFLTAKRSTQIYGLAGEAILNFGVLGIVPAFAVWGYIVGRVRRRISSYYPGDTRLMTAPYLINVCFMLLFHDMANITAVTFFKWLVPAFMIYLISQKTSLQTSESDY